MVIVHGGLISTLRDHVASLPLNLGEGQSGVTITLNVSFLLPTFKGDKLIAYAKLVRRGASIAFVNSWIENQEGKVIATGNVIYNLFKAK